MEFFVEAKRWTSQLNGVQTAQRAERSPIAQGMIAVMRDARRNGDRAPASKLGMYRALLTAETVATSVAARTDMQQVGREFFEGLAWEEVARTVQPKNLQNLALSVFALSKDAPAQLQRILADLS